MSVSVRLRNVALHHHVSVVDEVLHHSEFKKGFGMAVDSRRVLRDASRFGVQLVVHGHRHLPFIGREHVYRSIERGGHEMGTVSILGGGSAITRLAEIRTLFSIIGFGGPGLSLTVYESSFPTGVASRSSFAETNKFHAELTLQNGKLALGTWVPIVPQ